MGIKRAQLIAPSTGASSYTVPASVRATILAFSAYNPTAGAVACTVSVNAKVLDGKTLLAGESWIAEKVINQVLEATDVLAFAGAGVNNECSGLKEGA